MMTVEQALVSILVKVALALTLAGLFLRGTWAACRTFPIYLALVLACDTVVSLWPAKFYVGWFWILQQTVWDLTKLLIGLEILFRSVSRFPGARPSAFTLAATLLLVTTTVMLLVPARHPDAYAASLVEYQPRVMTATIWLMTGTALLVVWYRLPIASFQKAILIGFVPYLVVFTSLLNVLRAHGFHLHRRVNLLDALAFLAVTIWWSTQAWSAPERVEAETRASSVPQLQEA